MRAKQSDTIELRQCGSRPGGAAYTSRGERTTREGEPMAPGRRPIGCQAWEEGSRAAVICSATRQDSVVRCLGDRRRLGEGR